MLWDKLGIEPTDDEQKIKEAFARQSKLYHPEDSPEEFKELYSAYKTLLSEVKRENKKELNQASETQTKASGIGTFIFFDNMNKRDKEPSDDYQPEENFFLKIEIKMAKEKEIVLQKLSVLLDESNIDAHRADRDWKCFFEEKYTKKFILEDEDFASEFLTKIAKIKIYKYDIWNIVIRDELFKIRRNWKNKENGEAYQKADMIFFSANSYAQQKTREKVNEQRHGVIEKDKGKRRIAIFVLASIFAFLSFLLLRGNIEMSRPYQFHSHINQKV